MAKIVIDSTADGEICAMADVRMHRGRALDGQVQPYTNVVVEVSGGRIRATSTDAGYVNQNDVFDYSRAIVESAIQPSHHKELLTFERFRKGELPVEPVFYAYSNFDNHSKDLAFESEFQQDWSVVASLWGINVNVPVSLGMLIPRGIDGLLAAGRHLSVDHDMASVVRMQRDMKKCGEAAGLAAAIAIEEGISIREVCYGRIKPLLLQSGCLNLPAAPLKEVLSNEEDRQINRFWLTDWKEIKAGLASDKPGIAIWSAA